MHLSGVYAQLTRDRAGALCSSRHREAPLASLNPCARPPCSWVATQIGTLRCVASNLMIKRGGAAMRNLPDHWPARAAGPGAVASSKAPVVVNDIPGLEAMLHQLAHLKTVAVDCEGLDSVSGPSRAGKLCILSLAAPPEGGVFLVDLLALSKDAFKHSIAAYGEQVSVKSMLESPAICKLFFDVRSDSDALHHQHGVSMKHVYDLQVAEVVFRRRRGTYVKFVLGLSAALDSYVLEKDRAKLDALGVATPIGHDARHHLIDDEPNFWANRPLNDEQVLVAANDVRFLHHLFECFSTELEPKHHESVRHESDKRVLEYLVEPAPRKGRHRAVAPAFTV